MSCQLGLEIAKFFIETYVASRITSASSRVIDRKSVGSNGAMMNNNCAQEGMTTSSYYGACIFNNLL